jgi:hypothetical protein
MSAKTDVSREAAAAGHDCCRRFAAKNVSLL